jgi:hypothetical protein
MSKKPAPKKSAKINPVLGIDPGNSGAFILTDGESLLEHWMMPLIVNGKDKSIDFDRVHEILFIVQEQHPSIHVFIERAVPMAMGAKHAFNYGRGFAALEIAIQLLEFKVTYVDPQKWAKEMHEGISGDLKAKAKSMVAVKRLFPRLVPRLPQKAKGGLHDGPIDALLIAGYGLRKGQSVYTAPASAYDDVGDFI